MVNEIKPGQIPPTGLDQPKPAEHAGKGVTTAAPEAGRTQGIVEGAKANVAERVGKVTDHLAAAGIDASKGVKAAEKAMQLGEDGKMTEAIGNAEKAEGHLTSAAEKLKSARDSKKPTDERIADGIAAVNDGIETVNALVALFKNLNEARIAIKESDEWASFKEGAQSVFGKIKSFFGK